MTIFGRHSPKREGDERTDFLEISRRIDHTFDSIGIVVEEAMFELVDLTDTGLHARIARLEAQRRTTEAEFAAAIALADARATYLDDAHRSMKGYLKATCNWSNHEVSRWRSAAHAVNAHPAIGDAWFEGRIGAPQVFAWRRRTATVGYAARSRRSYRSCW